MTVGLVGWNMGWLQAAPLPSVEIRTTQDASPIVGEWLSLDAEGLAVRHEGSRRSIPLDSLLTVQLGGTEPRREAIALTVWLWDGSRIQPQSVTSQGQQLAVQLDSQTNITLPISAVRAIQLQELTQVQQTSWQAILDSRTSSDAMILVRSADSLDKIDGVIGKIDAESVQFEFGGQSISAPRAKLAGLRFFRPPQALPPISSIVTDVAGGRWLAAELASPPGSQTLQLKLAGGEQIRLPLQFLSDIDFSVGSMQYVADLTPLGRQRHQVLELPVAIAGADRLFGAHPIRLPQSHGPSLRFLGSGSITYRIPEGFSRLTGTVYLAPSGERFTACSVQVKAENRVIWENRLDHPSQRLNLEVPIQADQRLQLSVVPLTQFPVGDVVIWEELRLLK